MTTVKELIAILSKLDQDSPIEIQIDSNYEFCVATCSPKPNEYGGLNRLANGTYRLKADLKPYQKVTIDKKERVRYELSRHPEQNDLLTAEYCNASINLVQQVRREMIIEAQVMSKAKDVIDSATDQANKIINGLK